MRTQIYLYDSLRKELQKPIKQFQSTYLNRISPVFNNIEEESNIKAEEKYQELGKRFHPDYHDAGDFADEAWESGIDHYQAMVLMKYNTQLMWISTLYQFWEQQVRKFTYEEITKTAKLIDKNGNELLFKDFCSRGIGEIKEVFLEFNQDIEKLSSWSKINELRMLANVIKHGDGWSATELKKLRPDYFDSEDFSFNLFDLYKTTLGNVVLNIDDTDFKIYCDAIIEFWNELPERMYLIS